MLLALLTAVILAGAVLIGARRVRLRYRVAIAAALIVCGAVPLIAAFLVGDKPLPRAETVGSQASPKCQRDELSRPTLMEIVKARIRENGANPAVVDDDTRTRVEVEMLDCDYLVRLTFIPERPGDFTIYRISRAKKIVDTFAGE
jgi:hypothetical protein